MNWEDTFRSWGSPPGKTEREKMENTETAIKNAIKKDEALAKLNISVFAQGSYKTRTNVKQDSDVDVCIRLNSTFFPRYPEGKTREDYGNVEGSISFIEFKNIVELALKNYFGSDQVTRGNKAFDVHSNSYRVDADVLPAFAYRYYNGSDEDDYIKPVGVKFITDRNIGIINWPKQAYENGVSKQSDTGERYKKMVRIMKKMRNKMQENNINAAIDVSSFLIESLVWNVSNNGFNHEKYYDDIRYIIADCFNKTLTDKECEDYGEVNDIKYLFHPSQPWTRIQAHNFLEAAWDYIGYE